MIGLALASLVTWAIWLAKSLELRGVSSEVQKDLRGSRQLRHAGRGPRVAT
jgi:hypothetical protein